MNEKWTMFYVINKCDNFLNSGHSFLKLNGLLEESHKWLLYVYEFGKGSHESKIILKFRETD